MLKVIPIALFLLFAPLVAHAQSSGAGSGGEALQSPQAGQQQVVLTQEQLFQLLSEQVAQNNPEAMIALGQYYEQGVLVPMNFTQAMQHYRNAAMLGLPEAYFRLGRCFEIGMGLEADLERARNNYQLAAEKGHAEANYRLYYLYDQGLGVASDEAKAIGYLNATVKGGSPGAANELAVLHLNGGKSVPKNGARAVDLFAQAAERGNAEAMKNLGVMFRDGIEYQASKVLALKWFLIARGSGYPAVELQPVIADLTAAMRESDIALAESGARDWFANLAAKTRQ